MYVQLAAAALRTIKDSSRSMPLSWTTKATAAPSRYAELQHVDFDHHARDKSKEASMLAGSGAEAFAERRAYKNGVADGESKSTYKQVVGASAGSAHHASAGGRRSRIRLRQNKNDSGKEIKMD